MRERGHRGRTGLRGGAAARVVTFAWTQHAFGHRALVHHPCATLWGIAVPTSYSSYDRSPAASLESR